MVSCSRLSATVLALAALTWSCHPSAAPVDPDSASCMTSGTVFLAGLDLDRIRASPLYAKLPAGAALAIEPLRDASRLLAAWDGRQLVFVARGKFREPPAGATLIGPDLAISGPVEAVRGAIAQHKTGTTGAPDLLVHAATIAGGAEIWAVVRGGVTLPLTGNAANLNRLLHLVDYATLTAKLAPRLDLDLTGVSRTADQGQHLEETLRAIVSLAGAAGPRLDALLRSVQIRREGPTVHATLSTDGDTLAPIIDGLTR